MNNRMTNSYGNQILMHICFMSLSWFMGCVTAVYFMFLILPITLPYAVSKLTLEKKLLVNDKITTSCQKLYQKLQTTKLMIYEISKSVRLTSFEKPTFVISFNPLQV